MRHGLHLSVKGYQLWADALAPILTEILGPPAETDEAPPPTGDPSAVVRIPQEHVDRTDGGAAALPQNEGY